MCEYCFKLFTVHRQLNSIIVFDIDNPIIPDEALQVKHQNCHLAIKPVRMADIPSSIKCNGKTYRVYGIIERNGAEESGGHFVAYIRRDEKWHIFDDMSHQKPKKNTNNTVRAVALFYVLANSGENVPEAESRKLAFILV